MRVARAASASVRGAREFPLHLPVWYRTDEDPVWHLGMTERISAREAIVRGPEPRAASGAVRIIVSLPLSGELCGGVVVARGDLQRALSRPRQGRAATFVLVIRDSRLERAERAFDDRTLDERAA